MGTVFTLQKDGGGYFIAHYFPLFNGDGKIPQSSLFEGSDGALYGTAVGGGSAGSGAGVVFRLGDGRDAKLLHVYPLSAAKPNSKERS